MDQDTAAGETIPAWGAGLTMERVRELRAAAEDIRAHGTRLVSEVLAIGERLSAVKESNFDGYETWLRKELGWTRQHAWRFICVWQRYRPGGPGTLPPYPCSQEFLLLLAEPGVPLEYRRPFESGEREPTSAHQFRIEVQEVKRDAERFAAGYRRSHDDMTTQPGYETFEVRRAEPGEHGPWERQPKRAAEDAPPAPSTPASPKADADPRSATEEAEAIIASHRTALTLEERARPFTRLLSVLRKPLTTADAWQVTSESVSAWAELLTHDLTSGIGAEEAAGRTRWTEALDTLARLKAVIEQAEQELDKAGTP